MTPYRCSFASLICRFVSPRCCQIESASSKMACGSKADLARLSQASCALMQFEVERNECEYPK